MDNWPDDMEVPPQSSRAGNSNVFEGLEDLVDLNAVSSSGHHSKRLKKCNARKQVTPPGQQGKLPKKKVGKKPPVNPLEPVRASWVKVKAKEPLRVHLLPWTRRNASSNNSDQGAVADIESRPSPPENRPEIGRASCRERVCQYV